MLTPLELQKLHRVMNQQWVRAARQIELSYSEFEYLNAVNDQAHKMRNNEIEHGQHLNDIVAEIGVSKASASAMITKLEDRELVERFQCQMDARAHHIVLTKAGQALLAEGSAVYDKIAALAEQEIG